MRPAPFEYVRAHSVPEAVECLRQHGDGAKLLAGGQSLLPRLNLRLVELDAVIDVDRLPDLSYVRDEAALRVGALTRHRQVETHPHDLGQLETVRRATRLISHYPIRARGTVGGSLANADATAEWCLLALLLDAEIVTQGPQSRRVIPAVDFILDVGRTALAHDEMVIELRFPWRPPRSALREHALRGGDPAIVAVGLAHDLADGRVSRPRVVLGTAGSAPRRLGDVERLLDGAEPSASLFGEAGSLASRQVAGDGAAGAEDLAYRRWLAARLLEQTARETAGDALS